MNRLIMRGEEYKITSNENQYDLEVHENTLFLKRGEEVYITLDLDKVCLGTKLEILKNIGITLERVYEESIRERHRRISFEEMKVLQEYAEEAHKCFWLKDKEEQLMILELLKIRVGYL